MNEQRNSDPNVADDHNESTHRAPGLGLVGIAALAVAGWGLAGGPALPDAANLGWAAVGIGLLIGLILIISGTRSRV
ncbi:hypothetical protein [Gordonia rubripertincta]|uniref:DUF2631 domain-containing protein n=1 Tax=Gordonia rubripertincta TaxID=36822 RepID=A0AAW4G285_GORRU|nr:hypothetical protein [Gordonia rubripertincta]ASR02516.1 hypothetical protein GCWB2_08535 [Gordonia rubripertincta]MBM7277492.1 hypothetical protein [Gordonia rubripertincta]QMU20376.1 hypothetical protein H3V45_20465 [Gordonia rubripertincta]TSD96861.1 hypothetical protein FOV72_08925 [Gordonia rubripertincta]